MTFKIDGKRYKLKIAWLTVTLSDAVRICALEIAEDDLKPILGDEVIDVNERQLRYMANALSILSNCPADVLEATDKDSIVVLFDAVKYMVRLLYYMNIEEYEPSGVYTYLFNRRVYRLPESLVVDDNPILCYEEPCKNIIEASNIMKIVAEMKNEGLDKMRYVCALYLKEHGENDYDVKAIERKAELFKDLPMAIVWDVFFFMYFSLSRYMIDTVTPSLKEVGMLRRVKYTTLGFIQLLRKGWLGLFVRWRNYRSGNYATY
jgi:hypothetical protein